MDAKKSTRNQGAENSNASGSKEEVQQGDPVDILRADQQALCAALKELGSSEPSGGGEQVYDICRQHIDTIDQIVIPAMKKAGVAEDRLQEVLVWHDLLKLLLAELTIDRSRVQEYRAKQAVFTHLMNKLLKQEDDAGTGIFALLAAAKPDLSDIAATIRDRKTATTEQAETQQGKGLGLSILRLNMLARPQHSQTEDDPMERNQYERHRDDEGRFTSSRSDRYGRGQGRDDDYRSEGRGSGWHGDSRGHAEAARLGWEHRDDHRRSRDDEDDDRRYSRGRQSSASDRPRDSQGRFMSDDEDDRRYGRGRESSSGNRSRDSEGRFMSDDEDNRRYSRGGGNGNGGPPRDEYGRFTSDDDDHRRGSSGGYSYRERQEDDRRYGRSGHDDDDDRRYSSRGRGGRDDDGDDRGHGGWFGDSRGHAEAARRGWEERRR